MRGARVTRVTRHRGLDPYFDSTMTAAASLASPGDEGGFRVFTTEYRSEVTVLIETFGPQGEGRCGTDTVIELWDRTGER